MINSSNNLDNYIQQLKSYSRSIDALADSFPLLPDEECVYITLKNNANALIVSVNQGANDTFFPLSAADYNVTNSNQIEVINLVGTLEYIVHK